MFYDSVNKIKNITFIEAVQNSQMQPFANDVKALCEMSQNKHYVFFSDPNDDEILGKDYDFNNCSSFPHPFTNCTNRSLSAFTFRKIKNDGRVVSNFLIQALKNDDITIYGMSEAFYCTRTTHTQTNESDTYHVEFRSSQSDYIFLSGGTYRHWSLDRM